MSKWALLALAALAACSQVVTGTLPQDAGAPPDFGFDDAGRPIDGGFLDAAQADLGPRPDTGPRPPRDATVTAYDDCPPGPETVAVPVRVEALAPRRPAITGVMVPFGPESTLDSVNGLVLTDGQGQRVPAQVEVLSRYDAHPRDCGRPVRHAYAFAARVPSAAERWTMSNDAAAAPSAGIAVRETAEAWVIDTGAATFTVRRDAFEGLGRVEVGGRVVSESSSFTLERRGTKRTAPAPWYLALERRGPIVATVAARGFYGDGPADRDLGYTVRLHFHAGSGVVRVDHTVYHGEVADFSATGATNTTAIELARLRVALAEPTTALVARATSMVHELPPSARLLLAQGKRSPQRVAQSFAITSGANRVEAGTAASSAFLAARSAGGAVMAAIERLDVRDPQALLYDPATNSLDLVFVSEPITVGGARGIWSSGAIDFASPADAAAGDALLLGLERPALGVVDTAYLNSTRTIGPYATDTRRYQSFYETLGRLHENTKRYFARYRITGLQVWPDLPRDVCSLDGSCAQEEQRYFDGGENNYWNWSKPALDELFRTGRVDLAYDFSVPQARLFAETTAFRVDRDRPESSFLVGMAPCYGDSFGFESDFREGLNSRRDRCPGDYTYNLHLKLAYLATADRRFVDFFEEAGLNAVERFGFPALEAPDPFLELTFARLSFQRLENVLNGAEFALDPAASDRLRAATRSYLDFMLARVLVDGFSCDVSGSGNNNALAQGFCDSGPGWMMPSPVEWARRAARYFGHEGLLRWLEAYGRVGAVRFTETDGRGLPDLSREGGPDGWRALYRCDASARGVDAARCVKDTASENAGYFYANGIQSFLNVFGLLLGHDPRDPNRICEWLPAAMNAQLPRLLMDTQLMNDDVWGKSSGQSFGLAAEAYGALANQCP